MLQHNRRVRLHDLTLALCDRINPPPRRPLPLGHILIPLLHRLFPPSGIYGALKPYYYADVHPFFHDLDQLPVGG